MTRTPLKKPQVHDFAVIWDEDHDTRVIEAIEAIYMEGLLSPVQFVGERKGILTVIVAAKFYYGVSKDEIEAYRKSIERIASSHGNDSWNFDLGFFDRSPHFPTHQTEVQGIIAAEEHRVINYLRNVDSLWSLGTRDWKPTPGPWTTDHLPVMPVLPSGLPLLPTALPGHPSVPPLPAPSGWKAPPPLPGR